MQGRVDLGVVVATWDDVIFSQSDASLPPGGMTSNVGLINAKETQCPAT